MAVVLLMKCFTILQMTVAMLNVVKTLTNMKGECVKKNIVVAIKSLKGLNLSMSKYALVLLFIAPIYLFAQSVQENSKVYSPDDGIVCDTKAQFCVDASGISLGYTKIYFNQKAQDELLKKIEEEKLATQSYTFSNWHKL